MFHGHEHFDDLFQHDSDPLEHDPFDHHDDDYGHPVGHTYEDDPLAGTDAEWGGWDDHHDLAGHRTDEVHFGTSLPQEGLSEAGNTVSYSTSWNAYFDDKTGERVIPK